jgi:hypothetical protein
MSVEVMARRHVEFYRAAVRERGAGRGPRRGGADA